MSSGDGILIEMRGPFGEFWRPEHYDRAGVPRPEDGGHIYRWGANWYKKPGRDPLRGYPTRHASCIRCPAWLGSSSSSGRRKVFNSATQALEWVDGDEVDAWGPCPAAGDPTSVAAHMERRE